MYNTANAQTTFLDFNIDDAGNTITAGDGTPGSGYDLETIQPYSNIFGSGDGVTITSPTNILTVYNTNDLSGPDNDLSPAYLGGNNPSNLGFGNALILQTNNGNQGGATNNIDIPNDDQNGGDILFVSDRPLISFSFDFLDLDSPAGSSVVLSNSSSGESVTVPFSDFVSGSGSIFDSGAEFGDRHSNNVNTLDIVNLQMINPNLVNFDTILLDTVSSGGAGNVTLTADVIIPEPTTSALFGLGALSLVMRRKR